MNRLTDKRTAETLRRNAEKLREKGFEPPMEHQRYIKLADYENEEEFEELQIAKAVDDTMIAQYDDDLKTRLGMRAVAEIERLREENTKLKELLRKAVEDFPDLTDMWRYAVETLKLIGGAENDT